MSEPMHFFSLKRFWHNIWHHFPVPMGICLIFCCSFYFLDFLLSGTASYGLVLALTFSTAGSCVCRRFSVHQKLAWLLTISGFALGYYFGQGDVTYWLQMLSVGACVIVSCWTKHFYFQILAVPLWFLGCFFATFLSMFIALAVDFYHVLSIAAFVLAPFVFLGGLPFGDENFTWSSTETASEPPEKPSVPCNTERSLL